MEAIRNLLLEGCRQTYHEYQGARFLDAIRFDGLVIL
jgi:hypothetical protein